jgi:putative transposase
LRAHRLPPAPERGRSTWQSFLGYYRAYIVACDFFTVETLCLKTVYVLFSLELGTRRVHVAGCTTNPTAAWVAQ